MKPAGFSWRPVEGAPGVKAKHLGAFEERGVTLDFIEGEAGARYTPPKDGLMRLILVRSGEGECGGEPYYPLSALRLRPNDAPSFSFSTSNSLFVIAIRPLAGA
jgi:hypothetical protein